MSSPKAQRLIQGVLRRLRLASFGQRFYLFALIAAGVFAVALIADRLFALTPESALQWWLIGLGCVPVVGALVASIFHPKPDSADAAHAIDHQMQTKDLFLTAELMHNAPGEYKPLVTEEAEKQAPGIRPQTVVPFNWQNRAVNLATAVAILLLAALVVPSFDLWGTEQARQDAIERAKKINEVMSQTELRKNELEKKDLTSQMSKDVQVAVRKLEETFRKMDPNDRAGNDRQLQQQKKVIGDMWKKALDQKKDNDQKASAAFKNVSNTLNPNVKKMTEQLKQGQTGELQNQLQEMKDLAKELANETDPQKQKELQQQIQNQMQQMQDALEKGGSTPQLNEALKQAAQQMQNAQQAQQQGDQQQQQQAMQGLQDALGLSQMEMQNLQQQMNDMQQLQDAMQAAQAAQNANKQNPLDGAQCEGTEGMSQYQQLYNEMMGQGEGSGGQGGQGPGSPLTRMATPGSGKGGGMGGPGQGEGNIAPESEQDMATVDEKSQSKFNQAGKILHSWKDNKSEADKGEARKEYQQAIDDVKQNYAEAVESEDVPPGYHGAIGDYFSEIERAIGEEPATEAPVPAETGDE